MQLVDLLARTASLQPDNLTIREQTRLLDNPNQLRWRVLFPKKRAPSIKLSEITTVDFRPVSGRRPWDAPGREMPERFGPAREFEMIPMNPVKHLNEKQLQKLRERVGNTEALIRAGIIRDVDGYATYLANAIDHQLEVDAFYTWYYGSAFVSDPEHEQNVEIDLKFDQARYPVEPTPWDDATVNAYDRLVLHLDKATNVMGSVAAIRLRGLTLAQIVKDAPLGLHGARTTVANVEERLREDGYDLKFIKDERTYDAPVPGSASKTLPKKYVPQGRLAFQPESGRIGATHFASVTRAYDYVAGAGDRVDLQDVVVFHTTKNEGKALQVEAEAIAAPMAEEKNLYVVDSLIADPA